MSNGDRAARLQAYHDGELGPFGRWRVRRWLRRDEAARRELDGMRGLGDLLRAHTDALDRDPAFATPDLWADIRRGLPASPAAGAAAAAPVTVRFGLPSWVGAGLAAAATALVLAWGLAGGDASDPRSLRWLDARGHPTMVLQDDAEATIIWVMDSGEPTPGSGADRNPSRRAARVLS